MIKAESKVSNFASTSLDTIKNLSQKTIDTIKNILLPDEDLKQLEILTRKFKNVSDNIGNLINLVNLTNKGSVGKQERSETISHLPDEMELIGRENELECILDMILESKDKSGSNMGEASTSTNGGLIVIPIIGLGGVGKTALAQVVYNNQQVQNSFTLKAWVSFSENSDIKIFLEKTIQLLGGNLGSNIKSLEYGTKKLTTLIKNLKILIVFDDLSTKIEDQWDVLYTTLCCGAPRSIVIVTTQNKKFADNIATLSPIVLDVLEGDQFLKLFYRHTFGSAMIGEINKEILQSIAESIAVKLHGLPLAAKIIGNLLRSRIDENEWNKIARSEWWNTREGLDNILPSLRLNYQYLSPCLRQCFAYCSIFPKNYLFHKDRLIQMWIAHNFIPNSDNGVVNKLEDTGSEWFDKLVEGCFLQPAWDNTKYVMHNLMHDLATIVSTDECLILSENTTKIPKNVRHLALETNDPEAVQRIIEFKQLRTILYFGHCKADRMHDAINETLSKSKNVRVLDLSHMHMQNKKPPINIQNLTHLRFLDLSSTQIEIVGSSFKHYHLQTLYLQECKFKQLPRDFNNLVNLRHLYASRDTTAMIQGIGKLTNLQELNEFRIETTDGHRVTELREMNELSKYININWCENIRTREEAEQTNLHKKKHIFSVQLQWGHKTIADEMYKEILQGLEPHNGIADLKLTNYNGKSLPNWMLQMNNYSNLKSFTLNVCKHIDSLPSLGQLPSLNTFTINNQRSILHVDAQLYGKTQIVFPSLKELLFQDTAIEQWSAVEAREFCPKLSKVELISCYNLRDAPFFSFTTSLKILSVSNSGNFTSLTRCLQGLYSLTSLILRDCSMEFDLGFHNLPLLEDLTLRNCPQMRTTGNIQSHSSLVNLVIENCPKLFSISFDASSQEQRHKRLKQDEIGLQSLAELTVDHSLVDQDFPFNVRELPSIQCLQYMHCTINQFTIDQDAWFGGLATLKELNFSFCNFEHLPSSSSTLPSLKKLTLKACHNLVSFPENGISPFLRELHIQQCSPEFTERCRPTHGADWRKISHVACIMIEAKKVQSL